MTACRVDGREILVCNVYGQYYAVDGYCPHAGQRLVTGRLDGFRLRCPLHRASFDVRDGRALEGPTSEGVRTYPLTLSAGKVNVLLGG
jgi:nitrite reductase/ring-hydroxylating ferredoxin subunit